MSDVYKFNIASGIPVERNDDNRWAERIALSASSE